MAWTQELPAFAGESIIYKLITFSTNLMASTGNNGKLLKWDGDASAWSQAAGQLSSETGVTDLIIFQGELYGCTGVGGYIFKWDEISSWTNVSGAQVNTTLRKLIVFNNTIYTAGDDGKLYEWSGTALVEKAPQLSSQLIKSLRVYNNKLYAGTDSGGRLFEWNGVDAWVQVAPMYSTAEEILDLIVFENKLYGCTDNTGLAFPMLLQWNDLDAWIEIDQVSDVGTSTFYSMEIVDGVLYVCGGDDDLYKLDSGSLVRLFEGSIQNGIYSLHLYTKDYKMYGAGFGASNSALMDSSIQGTPPPPPNIVIKDKFANQGDVLIGL